MKKEIPTIRHIKPHSHLNDTKCPGELFPWKTLKLVEENMNDKYSELLIKYNALLLHNQELTKDNEKLEREKQRLVKILERRKK